MNDAISAALDTLDRHLASGSPDGAAVLEAFSTLSRTSIVTHTAQGLRRMFHHCTHVLGLDPDRPAPEFSPDVTQRLGWIVPDLAESLLSDPHGSGRAHVRHTFNHFTALNRPMPDGAHPHPIPPIHIPVEVEEAAHLAKPILDRLETQLAVNPYAHMKLAWAATSHPAPPFDRVIAAWLKDLDARGVGLKDNHRGLCRAMALDALAEERRQKVSTKLVMAEILPQLDDPNLMVAAAAAKFLGYVQANTETTYNAGTPVPLRDILDHIAGLPVRRHVAGGFLCGFDDYAGDPFQALRDAVDFDTVDMENWVLTIMADNVPEVYFPGSQAFWFYVHEAFCADTAFITRLMEAGHDWEAMMCATEIPDEVPGMRPILERLATAQSEEVSGPASGHLRRHYPGA